MSSDVAIRVSNLSKCYHIYNNPRDRLKQFALPRLQRMIGREPRSYHREFWALQDVSFEVKKGETVGLIGRNGSGKSTLLQMICGTLSPTSGSIQTNGRIAALLELGSGFNPEFTGRENVYMNAALLGLGKEEIDARFDDIAAFADIGDFIERPVKTYSSGMMVRLAFAVQAQVSPDIFIVDEALAVGDAKFQVKCFERLKKLKEGGTSILLVTHSSEQIVTHCSQAIMLENGSLVEFGMPKNVVNRYMDSLFGKKRNELDSLQTSIMTESNFEEMPGENQLSCTADVFSSRPGYNPHEYRWGDGSVSIIDYHLSANAQSYPSIISSGQTVTLGISVRFFVDILKPILGVTIKNKEGVTVYGANSESLDIDGFNMLWKQGNVAYAEAVFCCRLAPGDYFISLGIASRQGETIIPHDRRYDAIHFQLHPTPAFFGLVDLSLRLNAKKIA